MKNKHFSEQKDIDLKKSQIIKIMKVSIFFGKCVGIVVFGLGVFFCISIILIPLGLPMIPIGLAIYDLLPKALTQILNKKIATIDTRQSQMDNQIHDKNDFNI